MLARIPDTVWLRSLLCKQPPDQERGIPVSCEVDIYGALSEFIGTVVSNDVVTLLDINNTVPADMFEPTSKENMTIPRKIPSWASTAEIPHPASFPSAR